MSPDVIKHRFRWLGESYRVYLSHTNKIDEKHIEALTSSAKKSVMLLECFQQEDSESDQVYAGMGGYIDEDYIHSSPPSHPKFHSLLKAGLAKDCKKAYTGIFAVAI